MFLLRSGAIEGYGTLVSHLGHNPMPLLRDAGIVAAQLRQPNSYLPYKKIADLLDDTAHHCREPLFGLLMASRQSLLAIGEIALLSGRQPTVENALSFAQQNLYLHASGVHMKFSKLGANAEISLSFDFTNKNGLLQLSQLSAAQLFNAVRIVIDVENPKINLHLQQCAPKGVGLHEVNTYGKLRFESAFDGISFPIEYLKRSPLTNEELMREHLLARIQVLKAQYPDNLKAQVCHLIGSLLHTGDCGIEVVSHSLGLQSRMLQKRLQLDGCSFSKLLQETRLEIAKQNLLRDKTSITDLALNLGYADVSVFSRHFKQWTGLSPRNWRTQQLSPDQV